MNDFRDLIDVHHHVVFPDLAGVPNIANVDIPSWSVEASLGLMDTIGIRAAVLSLSPPGIQNDDRVEARRLASAVNRRFADIIDTHPGRFGAFATLPLPHVAESLSVLKDAIDLLNLDGVGIFSNYAGRYLGDPEFEPVWAEIARRGLPVHIHPTMPTAIPETGLPPSLIEFTFDTTRTITHMLFEGVLDRYPGLKLILSHAGGTLPFLAKRLTYGSVIRSSLSQQQPDDLIGTVSQLYYDVAASANKYALSSLNAVTSSSHILFGSDFPYAPRQIIEENCRDIIADGGYSDRDISMIARENAAQIFKRFEN